MKAPSPQANPTASNFDDFPPKAISEVRREYNPRLYGFKAGTLWPLTDVAAQRGEHRWKRVDFDASLADLTL